MKILSFILPLVVVYCNDRGISSQANLCSSLPHSMLLLLALLLDKVLLFFLRIEGAILAWSKDSCGFADASGSDVASYGSGKDQTSCLLSET